jgi:ketosteroid isomerase-like protein
MNKIEIVKELYEAFGRGDVPALLANLADEIQWESWADNTGQKTGVPWLKARTGKSGAAEFFKLVSETLDVKELTVLSIMEGENQVAVEFVIEADVLTTGKSYRDEEIHLWTFNDKNEIVRLRHYTDTAKHIAVSTKDALEASASL